MDWVVVGSDVRASKLLVSGPGSNWLPYAEVRTLRVSAPG